MESSKLLLADVSPRFGSNSLPVAPIALTPELLRLQPRETPPPAQLPIPAAAPGALADTALHPSRRCHGALRGWDSNSSDAI